MTDSTASAAPPKKRSLFKRAAWQDAPKKDSEDMFSHSNEFKDIVAEQARTRAEEKKKAEAARKRKHSEPRDQKRRRISNDSEELVPPKNGSASKERVGRTAAKARSITSVSPAPSRPPPDSLTARYDSLTKSASSSISLPQRESHVIDLGDSDEDDDSGYVSKPVNDNPAIDYKSPASDFRQDIAVRPSKPSPIEIKDDDDDDDDDDEDGDPAFAALRARARARVAAAKAQANGDAPKAPIVQLLIDPQMPDAKPLMVKVRVDSTIGKPRLAWCGKEKFSEQMTRSVFFTWKGTRLYDSTSIKRLGIQVDDSGNVSVQGDSNIYDDVNLPKIHVEAWTEDVYKQRKKEDAAAALAKKLAAEAAVVTREKTPTPEPEPEPEEKRFRLVLKAKGYSDFKLTVKESTTVAHIASAYKTRHKIDKNQPVTLMFDGDRMMPLDTVADYDVDEEETCMIEVLLK
ncbi:hypothetical protein CC77DRAFT_1040136 [Alternaria alternata]|uniref:Rad60/SUMO-like domain-containing protein n=1 Tax=Alternaria alternata TaxID=5599 RepID=A0A177DMC1_ALTAL|nr:hypothetical protein CC77DRAFT_1040136 [Alternaria alternata]OAG21094.1 hypothetical protein CC77DRAFT_1040136 [Alternaria alternata]RYN61562.1 hypothetical protein AA0118_g5809 [Alternaria tenuissima]RYN73481.1 hypothetical protein AA0117_g7702 [Alternaria alternata]